MFLVDDHEVVRAGLRALLEPEEDIEVVGEAGSVADALIRVPLSGANVAILDVRLPDGNGIEICRELRSQDPDLACLMLTSYADDEALLGAVMAGASGYILKQIGGSDFVADIRKVASGGSLLDPGLVQRVLDRMRQGSQEDQRLAALTAQERRTLELVAEGRTNRQIAEELYLAEKTVKNYVSNMLTKLGMQSRTEAAVFATKLADHRRREANEDSSGT